MLRLIIGFYFGCLLAYGSPDRDPLAQPNIVILMADDMGWGDVGIHGNSAIETPELDHLAKAGVRLDRFYVSAASAPTVASFLTGRHCLLTGVIGDAQGTHILHENEITFAEILQENGYMTGYFGEWLIGDNPPHDAGSQGFKVVGDYAEHLEFIAQHASVPFCAFVTAPSFLALGQSDEVLQPRDPDDSEELSALHTGIERFDLEVGNLINELEKQALLRHTLVVVLSDCGPNAIQGRFNSGLYGTQGSVHEGGLRVPSIWSWEGVIPAGAIVHHICHHTDLFSTLLGFAGAPIPDDRPIQGMNLAPLLLFGDDARWPNRNLGSVRVSGRDLRSASRSYRTTRWAAIWDPAWRRSEVEPDDEQWELYDLLADPRQHYNVADAYPFVLAGLKSDIAHWFHKSQVFGYPVIPSVLADETIRLVPRSAILPDGIADSESWGHVGGWTREGYTVSWPIEAKQTGEVRIGIEYRLSGQPATISWQLGRRGPESSDLIPSPNWRVEELTGLIEVTGRKDLVIRGKGAIDGLELKEVRVHVVGQADSS